VTNNDNNYTLPPLKKNAPPPPILNEYPSVLAPQRPI